MGRGGGDMCGRRLCLWLLLLPHAACIVTDVVGAPLEHPAVHSSTSSDVSVALTLSRYLYRGANGLQQYTRSFNGELCGPTIRVKPGDTLRIVLTNALAAEAHDTSSLHNNFKEFDTTNVHTHGVVGGYGEDGY